MNHVTVANMIVGKKYRLSKNIGNGDKVIYQCRIRCGVKEAICIEDKRGYCLSMVDCIASSCDLSHFYPLESFMVFVQGENPPTKEHDTYEEANSEAERLAKHYPNRIIYVYEVKRKFKSEETKVSKIVEL